MRLLLLAWLCWALSAAAAAPAMGASEWKDDLRPIADAQWTAASAAHLLQRAGFGGSPEEIAALTALGPREAVRRLVRWQSVPEDFVAFDESGLHDPSLEPFPASRPAATDAAKRDGQSIGVAAKPAGNRRLQPVTNKFFYWLRASRLETHRLSYWWAQRMLVTTRPLQEKMALFWHGHFATSEEKVRDYRKMLRQNMLLREKGNGSFRELLIGVAQDPAMLAYLDAGVNVKGAPNENFAREIMEMFTLGVGHYSEQDIREAARAFTGWNAQDLQFTIDASRHDDSIKRVLGREGPLDGVDVIDTLLAQPAAGEFIAGKIYTYFVRQDLSPVLRTELGARFRASRYDIAELLETIFLSRDFYSKASVASRVRPPVELVVSTYRMAGLSQVPGVPDFNEATESLGQKLFYPPTVAGWAQGRSWITPGLLIARSNFAYDMVYPDINFIPPDRYPSGDFKIRELSDKLALGMDVSSATRLDGVDLSSTSMQMADRDEEFNTRLASYRGWQMALERVKPIARTTARLDLSRMVLGDGCRTATDAVDALLRRFVVAPVAPATRTRLAEFLERELGTADLAAAHSYLDEPLRQTLHLILSLPEYQIG
ncbi:DUF1800 domain-containing protein [Methylibium sp.]|uniref:DUF1800 domain-containing protein n=1 Tax=Methylibium sp. TaxID=2067992 RepID=UPI00286C2A33|nr:DUF1800 domain-containing protein [Methylibium sp.]